MQLRIQNSEKKKLVSEQSYVREIQMKFLDKESSRQYTEVMEEIMKTNLRKQSHRSLKKTKSSTKSLHKEYQSSNKDKVVAPFSPQEKQQKVQIIKSEEKVIEQQVKKIPYKFSFKSFCLELVVAYAVTFAVLYFIKLADFPFFQIILVIAFTMSIDSWKSSNALMLIAIPIIIGNYFLYLGFFTYPSIVICYYAVMSFNQNFKKKQLFIFALVFTIIYGFIILPAIYRSLSNKVAYFYIFPVLMFIIRNVVFYCYWVIDHTAIIFLQLPLFFTGLQYGTMLTRDISNIQFWYMMVCFSLQIINDRTQFFLRILTKIIEYCSKNRKEQKQGKVKKTNYAILPAHANGYACIHSFHLFLLVYIYAQLNLYTAPYTSNTSLSIYTSPWFKPIIIWILSSVYEIMSLLLEKNSKHKMFFGYTSNKWWRSILRGFMLSLGMWIFYLGLGIGNLIVTTI